MTIPEGDFYDCEESERLNYTSAEEAVEAYLDANAEPKCDMVGLIRQLSPIAVKVMRRNVVTDAFRKILAERLFETLCTEWEEAYGDPEGIEPDGIEDDVKEKLEALLLTDLPRVGWQCTECASVLLSAKEVEAMMRAHAPEWFEGGAA